MNLISMKSCIVLLIIVVSSVADDIKWSDKPDVSRRVKRIDQKLTSFRQVVKSSREAFGNVMNNNCEKTSWGNELSTYQEEECDHIEITVQLYTIIFFGIVLIVLLFYSHIVYPESYLTEYKDNRLWKNIDCNYLDPHIV